MYIAISVDETLQLVICNKNLLCHCSPLFNIFPKVISQILNLLTILSITEYVRIVQIYFYRQRFNVQGQILT